MKKENRTFEQTLSHGNFIVRDHHVHDVRTLPGVTLLDMIYRLAPKCVGSHAIELRRVVFKQPIVTSEQYDKNICITFTPVESHWHVSVSSYKSRDNQALDDVRYENMECSLFPLLHPAEARTMDVAAFIRESDYQVDMSEVYGLALRADIKHYSFMKTLGTVYCRKNAELMQLRLGDEAEEFRDKFLAHPALLDGSTFAGQSIRVRNLSNLGNLHNRAEGEDNTPYIPFTIDRFCLYQPLPRHIYTYSENEAYWNRQGDPAQDVNATDVAIFNEAGELLAEFKKFSMKRIRSAHLIKSLLSDVKKDNKSDSKPQPTPVKLPQHVQTASPVPNSAPLPSAQRPNAANPAFAAQPLSIASLIKDKIAAVLQQSADELNVSENFYDLGMDSTQLLWLTKELEQVIGQELYPTLLFEYSSIEKLADYLSSEFDIHTLLSSSSQPAASKPAEHDADGADSTDKRQVLLFAPLPISQALPVPAEPPSLVLPRWVICVADRRPAASYFDLEVALINADNVEKVVLVRTHGESMAQKMENALDQVVASIKQLAAKNTSQDMLVQLVADADSGHSWATLFSGCFKTLNMELPRIRSQVILIDDVGAKSPDTVVKLLASEAMSARPGATRISYTGHPQHRYMSALQEIAYLDNDKGNDKDNDKRGDKVADAVYAFPESGAIVIAGGLGGLGLILADYLTTQIRPKLALLGRTPLDPAGQEKIQRLVNQGAEVIYLPVDLTNLTALEKAFRTIREKFGSVSGIVHSAGMIRDQVIHRKNVEDIASVVRPKISGLWHLDQVSSQDKIDFFMMFSSLSAITGNIGQVDYASANAFMDAFAFHRQNQVASGQRSGNTLSINWPLWAQGGMAIDPVAERMMFQSSGLRPLPSAVGMDIMAWALKSKMTQLVVAYGAEEKIRTYIASNTPTLAASAHTPPTPMSHDGDSGGGSESERANASKVAQADRSTAFSDDIAVIGMAGRYPQANNIGEFYQNLKDGKNCISRVPTERWEGYDFGYNIEDYYQFGGFVDRIDLFDPLLFGLPPVKAQAMDPQARLFLETAWEACEDAGFYQDRKTQHYRAAGEHSVGVFVGAFWSHYELFGSEHTVRGMPTALGVSLSSISNVTSYCMNFHGPSVAVDTMCSSALTSVHLACESIRRNECHYAIAGGVNLVTHPHKFIFLKENHFLSSEGVCRSFGENGDGYVPGEGVGAVMLTTLERAVRLGYPIRGIIKGSAINHCGKTAGGTVPNPVAQAEVIADALTAAAVDPRTVSYVEAHGTGTSLGDPIEIQGLTKAFDRLTGAAQRAQPQQQHQQPRQYCAIGSSKSNIGHLEAAAGIAGLTKLLLQLEHGEIFPSLHAEKLNPLIPFHDTPFYVEKTFRTWDRPASPIATQTAQAPQTKTVSPRRALISAFGASGSNASLVVEEYVSQDQARSTDAMRQAAHGTTVGIVLSARDPNRLNEQASRLLSALRQGVLTEDDLAAIAYTLQVGREPMDERLAINVRSLRELEQKLQKFIDGASDIEALYRGRVKRNNPVGTLYASDVERKATVAQWIADAAYPMLLELWVDGLVIDWSLLYAGHTPRRIHLPTYPFARHRYWVPPLQITPAGVADSGTAKVIEKSEALILDTPAAISPAALPAQEKTQTSQGARPQTALTSTDHTPTFTAVGGKPSKIALVAVPNKTTSSESPLAPMPISAPMHEAVHVVDASAEATVAIADVPSVTAIQLSLSASLAKTLFMELEEISGDGSFIEIGVDSIIAVQWIKGVNAAFSLALKATILYEYSTIESLSAHVHDQLRNPEEMATVSTLSTISTTSADSATSLSAAAETDSTPASDASSPTRGSDSTNDKTSDNAASAIPLSTLGDSLKNSLAKILFMETGEIDEESQFTEYGLDSIIAVQWIKSVNGEWGTTLKATVLYEHPTISALALYLHSELAAMEPLRQSTRPGELDSHAQREQGEQYSGKAEAEHAVATEGYSADVMLAENYRYALEGCRNVHVSLIEVSPGLHLEVFSAGLGAPVVLMTPMGALATVWMHQLRALSQKYRVIVFHYPGHGQSDLGAGDVTFAGIAEGIVKALDVMGIPEKLHLVGWSMGALIAERIALKNPDQIRSLTLIGTPARQEHGDQLESTIALMSKLVDDFAENVPASAQGKRESHFAFIRAPLRLDATIPYLQETLAFDYSRATEISSKTLVLFGGKDRVIAAEHGWLLTEQLPHAQCFEHASGGHYLPLQNHEWFNEKLLQFFNEVEKNPLPKNTEVEIEQIA